MVIYCTYDKENSSLVSRHRYVVAQNNNLSDTINVKCVGMTDPTAYGYYIDFVCMTHGGAVKAAYSSPALEYGEGGINFDVPNCLTQYEGYVEAQLVIYEKSRASVVAKSVGRTGGIFEVAASVNSLETRVIEPANMLTELSSAVLTAENLNDEVAKTVEEAREVKEEIESTLESLDGKIDEIVAVKMKDTVKTLPLAKAEFWFYDKLVTSFTLVQGKAVPEPQYDFPDDCVCDGWYCQEKSRLWDFATDVVGEQDVRLYANCRNSYDLNFSEGTLTVNRLGSKDVYLPCFYEGQAVTKVYFDETYSHHGRVFVNERECEFVNLTAGQYVVPFGSKRYEGGKYLIDTVRKKCLGLHCPTSGLLCVDLPTKCELGCKFSRSINFSVIKVLSDEVKSLAYCAKGNYLIFELIIKGNVTTSSSIGDFFNLQAILLLSDTPAMMDKFTYTSRNTNCRIYVPSHYMQIYKANEEWANVDLYPLEEYTGPDYSQTIYPTPEEFV